MGDHINGFLTDLPIISMPGSFLWTFPPGNGKCACSLLLPGSSASSPRFRLMSVILIPCFFPALLMWLFLRPWPLHWKGGIYVADISPTFTRTSSAIQVFLKSTHRTSSPRLISLLRSFQTRSPSTLSTIGLPSWPSAAATLTRLPT